MQLLNKLSIPEKLLHTGFIAMVCLGLLCAEAYLFVTHTGLDGKAGVTLKDIEISYYGDRSNTKLQSALPAMFGNAGIGAADQPAAHAVIDHWVANGETQAEYDAKIKPFIAQHCLACHSAAMSAQLHNPPLETYDNVKDVAKVDTGMSINSMLMTGMVHLTVLSLVFLMAGGIFLRSRVNTQIKTILVIVPFLGQSFDFFGWFLTHANPSFAILVMVGGALSCPVAALELVISFFDMWFGLPAFLQQREVSGK